MDFDSAFNILVDPQHEGGYVNDPRDPGGETKYGISKRAYPSEDIKNLTLERAKLLYNRDYWAPAGCDAVPDMMKFDLFDTAVNLGVVKAIKLLQHACGADEDGKIGPHTLLAVGSMPAASLLFRFDAARLVAYTEEPDDKWLRFGRGWIRRVANNMMKD